jgi:hypothetical protein
LHDEELRDLYSSPVYLDDHIKEDKMDRVCDTYGGEEKCIQSFGREM